MSDDYQIFDSKGKVIFELEVSKDTDSSGKQIEKVVFISPEGERLGEITAKIDENSGIKKAAIFLKRTY